VARLPRTADASSTVEARGRARSTVLADMLWVICVCYIDDLIIFGRTAQELLDRLDMVFSRLREVGLKLKANKSVLFQREVEFLGHLVTAEGIQPLPQNLEVIRDWPTPHCIRDVRAFYGLASYYRKFVREFGHNRRTINTLNTEKCHISVD